MVPVLGMAFKRFFFVPQLWLEGSFELVSVRSSVRLSVLPSRSFLGIGPLVFLKLSMVLGVHVFVCVTEADFLKRIFLPKKWGKWANNRPKIGLFEFIGKFSHFF